MTYNVNMKDIVRINSYDDSRFSETVLRQHGCFLVDDEPYEVEITGLNEAVVRGKEAGNYAELIEWFRFFAPEITAFKDEKGELIVRYDDPEVLTVKVSDLQPSQFYVDAQKAAVMEEIIQTEEDIVIQVHPYKGRYISLDGHTRLYIAVKRDYETVKGIVSETDYSIFDFVDEAVRRGITAPKDMVLLEHEEYETLWNKYCDDYFADRIWFNQSDSCKVSVSDEQKEFVSSSEKMAKALKQENVMGFDIMHGEDIIGFAMLRKYEEKGYFLWNYLIDEKYQHQGYGSKALRELIRLMTFEYRAENITTTCINGNDTALKMYQKAGFIITDVIDEDDIHETNLILKTEA